MKTIIILPLFVDVIPDRLKEGIIYICERYRVAAHKCCCGCGEEVITPLTPADWSVHKEGNTVSLTPSIGNWGLTCKSHYWIRRNQVVWAGSFSQRQIDQVRTRDRSDKEAYIAAINKQKMQAKPISFVTRLWQAFKQWLKS